MPCFLHAEAKLAADRLGHLGLKHWIGRQAMNELFKKAFTLTSASHSNLWSNKAKM